MMKKMFLAVAATMLMSTSMMAQEMKDDNNRGPRMNRTERMDKSEMAKRRTDETVKRYGLDEKQAALLLELNTKYADTMGPRRGMRREGRREMAPDSARKFMPRPEGNMEKRPERPERPGMRGGFEEMRKKMEEYDAELKTIMNEEQYKAYKEDMEKRMNEGPRRRQQ